jgi:hypothetical protein
MPDYVPGLFSSCLVQQTLNRDLLDSYQGKLYSAVCFSVVSTLEKILRMSLVDPWLHDKDDGFPILYVQSHAARLPGDLVRDWLFRYFLGLES